VPAFVLTHFQRDPIELAGGTTFFFVTGGVREALALARDAAGGKDIRIGGGANTVQQFLRDGLIDEMHIAVTPVILGAGERLFEGVNLRELGYGCKQKISTELATHFFISRAAE
jgi:dihydrofolate reductase